MIKTKECKIFYKQCKECGKIKFYKKFGREKDKKGKLHFRKVCYSCVHHKRKNQLNHKEVCDVCKREYSCNDQEHSLAHHFQKCNSFLQKNTFFYYLYQQDLYWLQELIILLNEKRASEDALSAYNRVGVESDINHYTSNTINYFLIKCKPFFNFFTNFSIFGSIFYALNHSRS